jgi:hypothetical protein
MIRSMDLAVAVGAAPVKEKHRSRRPRADRVTRAHMTLGAEPGISNLEKPVIDGPVGLMAIRAIFKGRRMRPEKRPPPLGMTGVTVFIDTGLLELGRIGGAMRIMAIRADELSFSERHMGRAIELRVSLQVTLAANFYLCPPVKEGRLLTHLRELLVARLLHQSMAGDAS